MNAPQLLLAGLFVLTPLIATAQTRTNSPAPKATAKAAPAPAPSPAASFEAFKSVPDRNIFNSRRSAGRPTETPPPTVRRDPVVETFSLLGTLDYPKGPVAFFEGSSSGHRKAVQVNESIGGCKVMAIESALVRLEANGKPVELKVGYMMRREDEGEWKTREADRPVDFSPSSSSSSSPGFGSSSGSSSSSSRDSRSGSSSSPSNNTAAPPSPSFGSGSNPGSPGSPGSTGSAGSSGAPSPGGAGESDLLKRLMEQRSRENR